jgi:hypothetical protein
VWTTGSGAPSTLHADGDYYLRTSNGEVYKQVSGAWVDQGFTLVGPQGVAGTNGTNGTNGTTWYIGSAVPSTLHANGDFYLRTTNGEVYQQVAGAWVDQTFSLIGPTGAPGTSLTLATQAEAEAGTENTHYMTALRVAQAIAALGGGGGSVITVDTQSFTSSGTWNKPTGGVLTFMRARGAGGPGGGGARLASTSARTGGSGGSGGGLDETWILTSLMGTSETVTVPTAPTGGLGGTSTPSNGNPGTQAGDASVGSNNKFWVRAVSGSVGLGGTATSPIAIATFDITKGFGCAFRGCDGASGTNGAGIAGNAASTSTLPYGALGGGGGGAGNGANLTGDTTGGSGGRSFGYNTGTSTGGTGSAGSKLGGSGSGEGDGGAGGGSGNGVGGDGGAGGVGAGGGGGGAGTGANGGNGGAGGRGQVDIYTICIN